jgi:hypothetical protein
MGEEHGGNRKISSNGGDRSDQGDRGDQFDRSHELDKRIGLIKGIATLGFDNPSKWQDF